MQTYNTYAPLAHEDSDTIILKKHAICKRVFSNEECKNYQLERCPFAHSIDELTPPRCKYDKECKTNCSRWHPQTECKCIWLKRLGRCPDSLWQQHLTQCKSYDEDGECDSHCVQADIGYMEESIFGWGHQLSVWARQSFHLTHDQFCAKLALLERYHSAYKASLAIILSMEGIKKQINEAIQLLQYISDHTDDVWIILNKFDTSVPPILADSDKQDAILTYISTHRLLLYK